MSTATIRSSESKNANLMVRLDVASKHAISQAAKNRRVSASNYVRSVVVAQALHEIDLVDQNTIALSSTEQLAFWEALNTPVKLTAKQKKLAALMQGKA